MSCGARSLALTAALFLVALSARAAEENAPVALTSLIAPTDPGCAVLVREHGVVRLATGYGLTELGTGQPINADTNFRLASLTKQFTAMAVMLLVHDGRLRYDATLADLLPGFPDYARHITVRHLLTHTSGLRDYEDLMDEEEHRGGPHYTAEHQIQDAEVLKLLQRQSAAKFAAGTQWAYSNSGYVMLGLIVGRVSGMPFAQFMQQRIFKRLGMNGSVLFVEGQNSVHHRAFGHVRDGGRLVPSDQSSTSATQGDGGIYTSVTDLAKWDAALEQHTLLPESDMRAALTPARLGDGSAPRWPDKPDEDNLAPGQPVAYGFGWFLDPDRGHERMWHFGTTEGFRTAIMRYPHDGVTVAVLCNRTDLDTQALTRELVSPYLGAAPKPNPR